MYVRDTMDMLDVLLYVVMETPYTGHMCIYQQSLEVNTQLERMIHYYILHVPHSFYFHVS